MAGMGPPPKPPGTRARRNAAPQTTTLSKRDRAGKTTPAWPLTHECREVPCLPCETETQLWSELWATPQASMWEQLGWAREVAQYVRWKVLGERGNIDAAKEARQWSDRLGLNPLAMLRLRWEIERAEDAEDRGARRRNTAAPKQPVTGDDPRSVLRAVK